MAIKQKTIDNKLKFINTVIKKIRRNTATMSEIHKACDTIYWLWKWRIIDREEADKLADRISDAMEGK